MATKLWIGYAVLAAGYGFHLLPGMLVAGLAFAYTAVMLAEMLEGRIKQAEATDKMLNEHLSEINAHFESLYDLMHSWKAKQEREQKNALIAK